MLKKSPGTQTNPQTAKTNSLSDAVVINGTFTSNEDVSIAGTIEGDVHVKGLLKVDRNGNIKGDINAESIDVSGEINGEIRCQGKVVIRRTAVIKANLHVRSLQVEENAYIDGEIHISKKSTAGPGNKTGSLRSKSVSSS